jgi:hypothetical protein
MDFRSLLNQGARCLDFRGYAAASSQASRANLTGDKFATDRILTRAFETDLDGLFFAFIIANLAGRILVQACGGEAQAVALVDSWINALVRDRARAALWFDLGSVPGFGVLSGFGLGLGFPFDPCGVVADGLPFGVLGCDALRGLAGPR